MTLVGGNYKEDITRFEENWMVIYKTFVVAFTNKCHVIIEHVPQAIERM